jgi:small subunit ribosomal protein S20
MANTKSAAKRARQTNRRALRNRGVRSRLRGMHKRILSGSNSDANQVRTLISAIDKAAKRGIIHRNAANRRKAGLRQALSTRSS